MTAEQLNALLRRNHACLEAVAWAKGKTLTQAWDACERADWMLWLVGAMADKPGWPTRQQVVLAACACARTALHLVEKGENRPLLAIETAERWANGKATIEDVRSAYAAAYAAYADAYAAAAHAAYAAYAAASAAAHAAYASYAAYAAALSSMAELVRKRIPVPYKEKQ